MSRYALSFAGSAEVMDVNKFQPKDSSMTYHTVRLGTVGHQFNTSCSSDLAAKVKVGDVVTITGQLRTRDGVVKLWLDTIVTNK